MGPKDNIINSVNLNAHTDFPYLVVNVRNDFAYPRNPGFRVMHWHEDLQFIYVLSGNILVRTLQEEKMLSAEEGIFINKNVVHIVNTRGDCEYKSFLFPDYFVSFYADGPAEKMTKAIMENSGLTLAFLSDKTSWGRDALEILRDLLQIEEEKGKYYSYHVLSKLTDLWSICMENFPVSERKKESPEGVRMRKFLAYIESHYKDKVTLTQLSGAANVSKSECLRCFKSVLHTTPFQYLIEYRLSKSAQLLTNTSLPVGIIASQTGWGGQSYFTKQFRKKMGCTPSEYRSSAEASDREPF